MIAIVSVWFSVSCITRRRSSNRIWCRPSATKPRNVPAASGARSTAWSCEDMRRMMKVIRPELSVAETASGSRRSAKRARSSLRLRSRSQSATKEPKSISFSLASTGAASRKCTWMNSPSLSAIRAWLLWMIAVCGIGRPSGRLNSATTAYQSASPPMVAASAKAAMNPNTGCTGSSHFATTNRTSVEPSTSVASAFTRRNSAARSASPGVSKEKAPDGVITASPYPSLRAKRSNPESFQGGRLDCFAELVIGPRFARTRWLAMTAAAEKQKARRSGPQIQFLVSGRSGGLVVDLGKIVLSGLRTVGGELAEIVGGRLGARDERFAAGAEQAGLDLDSFAERLGGRELVDAREECLGVLVDRLLDVAADLAGFGDGLGHRVFDGGGHALGASEHLGSTVLGSVGGLLDELAGGLGNFQVLDVLERVLEAFESGVGFRGHWGLSILIG